MTSSEDTSFDYDNYDNEMLMTWHTLPVTPASLEQLTIDELRYLDDSDSDLCKGMTSCHCHRNHSALSFDAVSGAESVRDCRFRMLLSFLYLSFAL